MKDSLVLLIFFFSAALLHPQESTYPFNYPGIPVIAHTNLNAGEITGWKLQAMKDLGVYGFYASEMSPENFSYITQQGLKVFPYQTWRDTGWVVYYTDAVYTLWEAEGKGDGANGDMELKYTSLGTYFNDGSCAGIKTDTNCPGNLIFGPAYRQEKIYKARPLSPNDSTIQYTANFRLKIKIIDSLDINLQDTVCVLKVSSVNADFGPSVEKVKDSLVVTLGELINQQWDILAINYNLSDLDNYPKSDVIKTDTVFSPQWMEYRVDWKGLSYLDLYVDYIEIFDNKGIDLKKNKFNTWGRIINFINLHPEYNDTTKSLGWFGLNEPNSIDNYEPFRIVNNLIDSATGGRLHLYTTFATGWGGKYAYPQTGTLPNGDVCKITEFYKRTKLPYISYNSYIYNYPHDSSVGNYREKNILEVTDPNLKQVQEKSIPLSYSTQSGKFYIWEKDTLTGQYYETCPGYRVPDSKEMLYHINLGLLYGIKELTCDPLFTLTNLYGGQTKPYRIGLADSTGITPLGETWRDTVYPRMSGLLGKTIKKLKPSLQIHNHRAWHFFPVDREYFYNIYTYPTESSDSYMDIGLFQDTTDFYKKYFMILNRYYNSDQNFYITLRNLTGYVNWSLTDYIDSTKETYHPDVTNKITLEKTIIPGDAKFFSLSPVVLYGGDILYNESFTANAADTLRDIITVKPGKTLTISTGSVYNIKADIIVDSLAVLDIEACLIRKTFISIS